MIIAVDFDGTIVVHEYPAIGTELPGAFYCLRIFQSLGARLILYTMRHGDILEAAVKYCRDKGVEFWGINENPEQDKWSKSRKVYADIYIDDAAFGCPLMSGIYGFGNSRRPVDWSVIGPQVDQILRGLR